MSEAAGNSAADDGGGEATVAVRRTPIRMCVICRGRFPKRELCRHVPPSAGAREGSPVADPQQALPGRGFYVCSKEECKDRMRRYSGWQRKGKGVGHDR